jgi:hypothetical protein
MAVGPQYMDDCMDTMVVCMDKYLDECVSRGYSSHNSDILLHHNLDI